jgi:mannose-1-phosphate guanylyltransferase
MDVMVLGAGRGTRLAALGLTVPKILVDVAGESLLARQLRYLAGQGVDRVVVNAHHLAEQVERFAAEHTGPPELVVVTESQLLGTAGGVRNAIGQLRGEAIVVLYGDVLTDVALAPIMSAHERSGAAATITVYESTETDGKGTVAADAESRLLGFREKGDRGQPSNAGPELINAGLYVLHRSFVERFVAEGAVRDFGHDVFPDALARGTKIAVYRLPAPVLDIGTPLTLRQAQR